MSAKKNESVATVRRYKGLRTPKGMRTPKDGKNYGVSSPYHGAQILDKVAGDAEARHRRWRRIAMACLVATGLWLVAAALWHFQVMPANGFVVGSLLAAVASFALAKRYGSEEWINNEFERRWAIEILKSVR